MKELKTIKERVDEYTNNKNLFARPKGEPLNECVERNVREAYETGAQTVIDELEFLLKDYDRYDRMSCCLIRELIKKLKGETE